MSKGAEPGPAGERWCRGVWLGGRPRVLLALLGLLASATGCEDPDTGNARTSSAALAPAAPPAPSTPTAADEAASCRERIASLGGTEAFGASAAERRLRAHVLGRAKAEPVLFVEAPAYPPADDPEIERLRARLDRATGYRDVRDVYRAIGKRKAVAQAVLTRGGYVYAEHPGLATALVDYLRLEQLFSKPRITIERGGERLAAARNPHGDYVFVEGPEEGRPASVLLYDRVWEGEEPPKAPPLHRDVRALAAELGFERLRPIRRAGSMLSVALRYGEIWVPALLQSQGTRLSLVCEAIGDDERPVVEAARELQRRRRRVLEPLVRTIEQQVEEGLPFDEPRTEEGQQDGKLRLAWATAYREGRTTYEFNGDEYRVFDAAGRPRVPQVCIDFIVDTLERASGTWWLERGNPPTRTAGRLDFRRFGIQNRRSVESFVDFAWRHPQLFDVVDLAATERVRFARRERFFDHLFEHRDRYVPGDIVTILGPRDDEELHYHSFFVLAADPVTAMPVLVAANAGRPRLRTWEQELRNAPRRSIRSRLRPRLEWLESALAPGSDAVAVRQP